MEEYKMTKVEQRQLTIIMARRDALTVLMDSLLPIGGGIRSAEKAWWEGINKRLGISKEDMYRADAVTGKIWR